MSKATEDRLLRLEAATIGRTRIVWCDDPEDLPAGVSAMRAAGELLDSDKVIGVGWRRPSPEAPETNPESP